MRDYEEMHGFEVVVFLRVSLNENFIYSAYCFRKYSIFAILACTNCIVRSVTLSDVNIVFVPSANLLEL